VSEGVYVKRKSDVFFRSVKDVLTAADTRIIDKDGRLADVFTYFGCDRGDGGGGGDVAFVVIYSFRCASIRPLLTSE
jgi:hypothetical protein